ncbi:unnamed protein product [Clonostachys solani]|uniref:Transferrin-like domain-containing protein n=1 Tax=Clonostachys solani TaxID=160281 RepID=A0A9N9ZAL5_9HYPO|nr:unnamed protein product [Clonostachys solani]
MNIIKTIYGLCIVAVAAAKLLENPGCGDINVLYTGFPAYHPYVVEQGWDPVAVDAGLRQDAQNLIDAGYNTRIVLMGPDQDISQLEARFQDVEFHVTGIGFGMRPATIPEIITRFEGARHDDDADLLAADNNFLFRKTVPDTPTVYNYDPNTLLWSVARRFPIEEDCTNKPGKNLGYEEICDQRCEMSKIAWNLRQVALGKNSTISNEAASGI